eukprot:m.166328 g.166328  ORF g.166328 m.166328 type:complete len:627 (-) comp16619_c0_seq9:126-2006(-)
MIDFPVTMADVYRAISRGTQEFFAAVNQLADIDVQAAYSQGETFLHRAAAVGNLEIATWLINNNAPLNAVDNTHATPLALACTATANQDAMVQLLLKANVDYALPTLTGDTPLHLAVAKDRVAVAISLLKAGADPNAANAEGGRPLHYAISVGMIVVLTQYDADVSLTDNSGSTPAMVARQRNRPDLAQHFDGVQAMQDRNGVGGVLPAIVRDGGQSYNADNDGNAHGDDNAHGDVSRATRSVVHRTNANDVTAMGNGQPFEDALPPLVRPSLAALSTSRNYGASSPYSNPPSFPAQHSGHHSSAVPGYPSAAPQYTWRRPPAVEAQPEANSHPSATSTQPGPLQALVTALEQTPRISNLEAILTARVPIIKLTDSVTKFHCDINCDNVLGLRNTELLACYGRMDPRFLQLGFFLKRWAKVCHINDASQGYMSSYALIMMLLHYLQHTSPPVLPYLQQAHGDEPLEPVMVDGWNAAFYQDVEEFKTRWPVNTSSTAALLIGFFDYYCSVFNFGQTVVNVRDASTLLKSDLAWHTSAMAVQDPFDHSHNLTKGVKPAQFLYILDRMEDYRRYLRWLSALSGPVPSSAEMTALMLDPEALQGGTVPPMQVIRCYKCQKTGHMARDCKK